MISCYNFIDVNLIFYVNIVYEELIMKKYIFLLIITAYINCNVMGMESFVAKSNTSNMFSVFPNLKYEAIYQTLRQDDLQLKIFQSKLRGSLSLLNSKLLKLFSNNCNILILMPLNDKPTMSLNININMERVESKRFDEQNFVRIKPMTNYLRQFMCKKGLSEEEDKQLEKFELKLKKYIGKLANQITEFFIEHNDILELFPEKQSAIELDIEFNIEKS